MSMYVCNKIGKQWRWILSFGIVLLLIAVLVLLHPILAATVIPSIDHSGIDLYQDGSYLSFDKGETFHDLLSEFSFVEHGDVTSFVYHDSSLRESWYNPTFPDAYILELDMGQSYALVIQELETREAWNFNEGQDDSAGHAYAAAESGDGDYLFVIAFADTQRVVCLLITDTDSWGGALGVWHRYFPVPGEPAPIPVEKP